MKRVLLHHNLLQLVLEPTQKKCHILDWVVIRESANTVFNLSVQDKAISDHFLITFDTCLSKPSFAKRTISCRNLKCINHDVLSKDLNKLTFPDPNNCLEKTVDRYNSLLKSLLDNHAPLRYRTVSSLDEPWNKKCKTTTPEG